jgi:hypothetical protein
MATCLFYDKDKKCLLYHAFILFLLDLHQHVVTHMIVDNWNLVT